MFSVYKGVSIFLMSLIINCLALSWPNPEVSKLCSPTQTTYKMVLVVKFPVHNESTWGFNIVSVGLIFLLHSANKIPENIFGHMWSLNNNFWNVNKYWVLSKCNWRFIENGPFVWQLWCHLAVFHAIMAFCLLCWRSWISWVINSKFLVPGLGCQQLTGPLPCHTLHLNIILFI